MKDMLLTYNEYNPDLGYVQGMSDLLAPLYAVMQDDAVAFWAFVGFMDRMVTPLFLWTIIYRMLIKKGTKLPAGPIRHADSTPYHRPPRATYGSATLPSSAISRQHQFLLLLPHASCLVQTGVWMGRCVTTLGDLMDGLLVQQLSFIRCHWDPRKTSGRYNGSLETIRWSLEIQ